MNEVLNEALKDLKRVEDFLKSYVDEAPNETEKYLIQSLAWNVNLLISDFEALNADPDLFTHENL